MCTIVAIVIMIGVFASADGFGAAVFTGVVLIAVGVSILAGAVFGTCTVIIAGMIRIAVRARSHILCITFVTLVIAVIVCIVAAIVGLLAAAIITKVIIIIAVLVSALRNTAAIVANVILVIILVTQRRNVTFAILCQPFSQVGNLGSSYRIAIMLFANGAGPVSLVTGHLALGFQLGGRSQAILTFGDCLSTVITGVLTFCCFVSAHLCVTFIAVVVGICILALSQLIFALTVITDMITVIIAILVLTHRSLTAFVITSVILVGVYAGAGGFATLVTLVIIVVVHTNIAVNCTVAVVASVVVIVAVLVFAVDLVAAVVAIVILVGIFTGSIDFVATVVAIVVEVLIFASAVDLIATIVALVV